MKETKYASAARDYGTGFDSRTMVFSFGVSILFHLVFLGTLIFAPEFSPRPKFRPGVVNVSLVSLPSPGTKPGTGVATVVKEKVVKKEPLKSSVPKAPPPKPLPVVKKPQKTISLTPKKKAKKSLKKKTIDRPKLIENAIDRIEKKVEKSETDSVAAAIDRLKKQVAETESSDLQATPYDRSKFGTGGAGPAEGSGVGGPLAMESIRIYQAEIQYQIQKNWAFSQQLAGDRIDLEAVLAIKILRNGEIEDIWFDKKSGNTYLDESAYKAVIKSNPLPPLPKDFLRPYYKIGLIFGPKGLKQE